MNNYEIHINGEKNPFYTFQSSFMFKIKGTDEKMYIKKDGKIHSISIMKISHDITTDDHVVRLHCIFNKLFDE